MKKIKIFMLHLGFGGIEKQTITMANALVNNYDIEIVSFYKLSKNPAYKINEKIKVKYLYDGGPNKKEFIESLKKLKLLKVLSEGFKSLKILWLKNKLIKNEIIKNDANIFFSTREEYGKLISKYGSKNILKVTQEHNFIDTDAYKNRILKEYKNLDYVVVISKYHEKMYNDWFKNSSVKVIRIENILDSFPKNHSALDHNAVVAAGRFNWVKDFTSLIKVINLAVKDNPKLKLYLLGDGEEKGKILNLIREYNLQNNVIITGFVSPDKVEEYMLKSDIYLMTSISECFPMVLLEAYSMGLPVISYDILSGPKEIVKSGETGYLISNRDINVMAKKINELLYDKEKLKLFGKNALAESYKYKADLIKQKWINLFK